MLRLMSRPGTGIEISRYLREDLADGLARGRFDVGPDDATLDQVGGLIIMTIRRIVEGRAGPDTARLAVERALRALGVDADDAAALAGEATAPEPDQTPAS